MSRAGKKSIRVPVQAPQVGIHCLAQEPLAYRAPGLPEWMAGKGKKGIKETPGIAEIMQAINLLEVA